MASISPTSRPGYVYDSATDTWIPIGIGPHTHQATDLSGVVDDALIDAKGDLIVGSAADTPARLAAGNNGDTLVADSSQTTGLRWGNNYGFTAGKNKIINGDFRINQRAFSSTTTNDTFGFDRWKILLSGGTTYSTQTFTPGTAPVAGYEGINFARVVTTGQSGAGVFSILTTLLEDVRLFAGQTITVSFWAKANSGTPKVALDIAQLFGSGGSAEVNTSGSFVTLTTSWARYSLTVNVPSVSGKTIGAGSSTGVLLWVSAGTDWNTRAASIGIQTNTFDFWGVQAEVGSVATAFQTATGTLAGELAACQRYYVRYSGTANNYAYFGNGTVNSSTNAYIAIPLPVEMRVLPTSVDTVTASSYRLQYGATAFNVTSLTLGTVGDGTKIGCLSASVASGLTTNGFVQLLANNSSTAYVGFSAEL